MLTVESLPLTVSNLGKSFRQGSNEIAALANFNFDLKAGEFVTFMGASGSGKSTLLHLMAGLTRPDTGSVEVEGQDLSKLSDGTLTKFRRRRIGLVFQALNLVPTLSALENVCLPLQADNSAKDEYRIAASLLEKLGHADRQNHLPGAMSGGEQQRVAIARALSIDPALILADEPTGNLDSANSRAICQLLRDLNQNEGRSIVLVTHEPEVAMWSDRVVILKDGHYLAELQVSDFQSAQDLSQRYHQLIESELEVKEVIA